MIKTISDEYVYKKEVDWSLFNYGFMGFHRVKVKLRNLAAESASKSLNALSL